MKTTPVHELKAIFRDNEEMCREAVTVLELAANKSRLRTVCMLMHGEYCVKDIVDVAGDGKATNLSQQLRMLRLAGVVTARREGKKLLYRLNDGPVQRLVEILHKEYLSNNES